MPFNCDPCQCTDNHYRHEPTWKKAVLTVLCAIATAITNALTNVFHVIVDSGQIEVTALPAVVVSTLPSIPAGDNNIGNVDIVTMPNVTIGSMPDVVLASDSSVQSVRKTVTNAGTREQLASQACKRVDIMALPTNTDIVCVGGTAVVAAVLTRNGIALSAGQTYSVSVNNTNLLWVDTVVSGEGVCYNYFA